MASVAAEAARSCGGRSLSATAGLREVVAGLTSPPFLLPLLLLLPELLLAELLLLLLELLLLSLSLPLLLLKMLLRLLRCGSRVACCCWSCW